MLYRIIGILVGKPTHAGGRDKSRPYNVVSELFCAIPLSALSVALPESYHASFVDTSLTPIVQTFGEKACHSERSEESGSPDAEILRFAENDRWEVSSVRS